MLSRLGITGWDCCRTCCVCVQTDAMEVEDKRAHKEIMDDASINVSGAIEVFRLPQVRVGAGRVLM